MVSIVHEGLLYLGRKPSSTSAKDWKRFLFVLKHHQETKRLFLDYYKDSNKRWQKQEKKGSIDVLSYCHFSLAHNCSYMFPLKVTTASDGDLFLAAGSFESMNKWYNCLQKNCYLLPSVTGYYEFSVVPRRSPSTELIGASGDCLLAFTPQKYIVCVQQSSKQVLGAWPYGSLRKYWGDKETFGFICGRRAPRGEGEFKFQTTQGEDIFRILERLIKVVSVRPQEIPVLASVSSNLVRGRSPGLGNTTSEEGGAGRDSRPQQPLPKPPELRKRLSLAEPLPPIPDQSNISLTLPQVMPKNIPSFQQEPASNTVISDTSPVYFTSPAVPLNKSRSFHHNTPSPPSQGAAPEVPQMRRALPNSSPATSPTRSNDQEDDTYSHTSHNVPVQFSRNASFKMVRGDNIYHGLVRSDSLGSKMDRTRRASDSSSPDLDMYDLAYRPSIQHPRELVPVKEGEYESVGDASRQLRLLKEQKMPMTGSPGSSKHKNGDDSLSFGEKLRYGDDSANSSPVMAQMRVHRQLLEEQDQSVDDKNGVAQKQSPQFLTDNPMYGSRDNIFSDATTDTASSIERERERSVSIERERERSVSIEQERERSASSGSGSAPGGLMESQSPQEEQIMNDMERSMIMNPSYSDCRPPKRRPEQSRVVDAEGDSVIPELNVGGHHIFSNDKEPLSPLEDSMVDNPMYGGRSDLAGIGGQPNNNATLLSSPNRSQVRNVYEETDNDSGEAAAKGPPSVPSSVASGSLPVLQNLSCSPESQIQTSSPIVRSSAQGYTKIVKPSGSNGEDNSPPPPLPPRLYSESNA